MAFGDTKIDDIDIEGVDIDKKLISKIISFLKKVLNI